MKTALGEVLAASGHPSFPSAITCCFFSSLKTLLMLTEAIGPLSRRLRSFEVRMRLCCRSEPAVVGFADFLASHDAFLVYGGLCLAYRLQDFVKAGATVQTKQETNDHFLALVTYTKENIRVFAMMSEPSHIVAMKLTPLACSGRLRLPYTKHGIVRVFGFPPINKLVRNY
jgi:hypothetical protein